MRNKTILPVGEDKTLQGGHNAYLAPKITMVQFKVEAGYYVSVKGINGGTGANAWQQSESGDGTQTYYFGERSF